MTSPDVNSVMILERNEKKEHVSSTESAPVYQMPKGFKFIRVLGTGAFSYVVLATKNRKKMILKFMRKPSGYELGTVYDARFKYGLKHKNIVDVYDVSRDMSYILMEYCNGGNLWDQASERSPKEILPIIMDTGIGIGKALWAIHSYGIVHLDIKPENILFEKRGKELVPKLSDFGIARSRGSITLSTTPLYLPPGYTLPVIADPRLDLYQLCLSLYFVLATVVSRKTEKSYLQLLKEKRTPIRNLWSNFPVEIDNILLNGINAYRKDFSKSYQNAIELVSDFESAKKLESFSQNP